MVRILTTLFLTVGLPLPLASNHQPLFVLWNVGQGQWLTYSSSTVCVHFDIGGEFIDWREVQKECRGKVQQVFISHGDWDHISFLRPAEKRLGPICIALFPREKLKPHRRRYLNQFDDCEQPLIEAHRLLQNTPKSWSHANDHSHVLMVKGVLMPGDGAHRAEKLWMKSIRKQKLRAFVLGHHGSKNSNHEDLLKQIHKNSQVLGSSREKRYRHPHPEVLQRLKRHGLALVTTEDWGHIRLSL